MGAVTRARAPTGVVKGAPAGVAGSIYLRHAVAIKATREVTPLLPIPIPRVPSTAVLNAAGGAPPSEAVVNVATLKRLHEARRPTVPLQAPALVLETVRVPSAPAIRPVLPARAIVPAEAPMEREGLTPNRDRLGGVLDRREDA